MKDFEERIIKIETDIVYLQDTVRELNDIVSSQQALVMKLERQNEFLARRLEDLDVEARPSRKSPHY